MINILRYFFLLIILQFILQFDGSAYAASAAPADEPAKDANGNPVSTDKPISAAEELAKEVASDKGNTIYKNERAIDDELIYRATFGRAEDVAILLKEGASPQAINSLGWPALVVAAGRRDSEAINMVKALVEGGADVNRADINKNYPLIYAVKNNDLEMVKYLMSKGASYNVRTPEGSTPREIAVKANFKEIIAYFDSVVEAEKQAYANERTTDRYNRMLYDLAYSSCAFQYFSYYYTSKQDKVPEDTAKANLEILKKQIVTSKTLLVDLFNAKTNELDTLSSRAMKMVYDQLETYISNTNRRKNGVGKEADKHQRCDAIALLWQPIEVQQKVAAENAAKEKKKKKKK